MLKKDKNAIVLFSIYTMFVITAFINVILPNMGLVEDSPFVYDSILISSFIEIFTFMFLIGKESFSIYSERAKLLEKQKGHQQEMLLSMVESQEQERNRVGRELHDLIGANMAIIKQRIPEKTGELYDVINDTIAKVRNLSHGLVTPMVKDDEFLHEIREMCHLFSVPPLKVHCMIHSWPSIPSEEITHHLYRICQELLQNASKHSKASDVYLQLIGENDRVISIIYEDNGVGFDSQKLTKGLGINNIKNRVTLLGGAFEIDSTPNRGTTQIIQVQW